ncbi:hypothetical protein [Sandaracinus amylolyticus]|uniref:Lipoprotein n=1 Tax=Sandaracinus amylolyticus TaxID=927083 RepID=A0A0F6YFJ7_9BACT|nr:hypothetical protein [Sandaracinus amylolyticus]AKF03772.1 hypothetical protein DB32_000921 [Sandaracinus amylolyticus]
MTSRAPLTIALALVVVPGALALSGCSACGPPQSASAQDEVVVEADGGVVQRTVIVPVPVPAPEERPAPEPEAPATCYEVAANRTNLTEQQIALLCSGAWSSAPIQCYLDARARLTITDPQRIGLCRCADSTAPVDCYRRLQRSRALTDVQVESLCAPVIALGLLDNCRPAGGF